MNNVRYQLVAADCIKITKLRFEHAVNSDSDQKSGSHLVVIVGKLDIEFECKASMDCIGESWKLFVWVDDNPIITTNGGGYISGGISNNGKSSHYGGYNW